MLLYCELTLGTVVACVGVISVQIRPAVGREISSRQSRGDFNGGHGELACATSGERSCDRLGRGHRLGRGTGLLGVWSILETFFRSCTADRLSEIVFCCQKQFSIPAEGLLLK